jgi:hypothetical protein
MQFLQAVVRSIFLWKQDFVDVLDRHAVLRATAASTSALTNHYWRLRCVFFDGAAGNNLDIQTAIGFAVLFGMVAIWRARSDSNS